MARPGHSGAGGHPRENKHLHWGENCESGRGLSHLKQFQGHHHTLTAVVQVFRNTRTA